MMRVGARRTPARTCSSLEELAQPTRAAGLGDRHRHGRREDSGGSRARALHQDGLDALISHRLGLLPYALYAFFSSTSAHLTASSGFMPLIAWAYMSTRMYLTSASDAFRLGGPG